MLQVALQRADGSRTQGSFPCSASLWEVLIKFEDLGGTRLVSECTERGEKPCLSFMNNKKWEGKEALESQTLLHLGLVSGTALLKHTFLSSEPSQAAAGTFVVCVPGAVAIHKEWVCIYHRQRGTRSKPGTNHMHFPLDTFNKLCRCRRESSG